MGEELTPPNHLDGTVYSFLKESEESGDVRFE